MNPTAIAINCTLKSCSDPPSSTDRMIGFIAQALKTHDVETKDTIRIAEHAILPGVTSHEGPGDAWPEIRTRILAADILIFGTPIWLGQPSSLAKRALERRTGARGLRSIIEHALLDIMFDLPSLANVQKVVVYEGAIGGEGKPLLIYSDQPKVAGGQQ